MIYKLIFDDKTEYCQAKSQLHLLQSYHKEYDGLLDINEVVEIPDEDAKTIMLKNSDYDETNPSDSPEFSLYEFVVGDDFCIVGGTEYL